MRRLSILMIATLAAGMLFASPAEARKIYLNGVDLGTIELPAVTLKGCEVTIDARGNVFIQARGYKIQVDGGGAPARPVMTPGSRPGTAVGNIPTIGNATAKYYLVSFFNKKGATQYDIEIFINGQMIRRIRATSDQVATDITRYIKRGQKNEVIFVSRKNLGAAARLSSSPMDYFRVVLGSGFESKGQIVLKRSLVEVKRTADQAKPTVTEKHVYIFR